MLNAESLVGGRYRIDAVIAVGGMGVVYRAYDDRLQRSVAIKMVRSDDPELVRRLRREADHLARLCHPNIVRLFDVGEHDGWPYLVFQLVEGDPLRALLGRLPAERVAWIGERIASALVSTHVRGIVHRDLKPGNVLVSRDSLCVLDFGIARHVDEDEHATAESLVGTPSYISPEQLCGLPAGPPADVYALGLVLIECFTGRPAYEGTFAETIGARLEGPPAHDVVPPSWWFLLDAMTSPRPEDRPTASAVADRVRRAAPGSGHPRISDAAVGTRAPSDSPVPDRRAPAVLAAVSGERPADPRVGAGESPQVALEPVLVGPALTVVRPPAAAVGRRRGGRGPNGRSQPARRSLIVPATAAAVVGFVAVVAVANAVATTPAATAPAPSVVSASPAAGAGPSQEVDPGLSAAGDLPGSVGDDAVDTESALSAPTTTPEAGPFVVATVPSVAPPPAVHKAAVSPTVVRTAPSTIRRAVAAEPTTTVAPPTTSAPILAPTTAPPPETTARPRHVDRWRYYLYRLLELKEKVEDRLGRGHGSSGNSGSGSSGGGGSSHGRG